jgi:hypothetical protein
MALDTACHSSANSPSVELTNTELAAQQKAAKLEERLARSKERLAKANARSDERLAKSMAKSDQRLAKLRANSAKWDLVNSSESLQGYYFGKWFGRLIAQWVRH